MIVRPESSSDWQGVRSVHLDAFPSDLEANIVGALRADDNAYIPALSIVAELDSDVVGHSITSHARFEGACIGVLGPIAVMRTHQRRGIGSELMKETIRRARGLGYDAIVLIGHPSYYPRFGFAPASQLGLKTEYDVPDEAAMALRLSERPWPDGVVRYPRAFAP